MYSDPVITFIKAARERFPAGDYRAFAEFQRDAIRGIELPVVLQ
jgi:hypothetical protein